MAAFPIRRMTSGRPAARALTAAVYIWRRCAPPLKCHASSAIAPLRNNTKECSREQTAFIKKLWNGSYFNYDTGSSYKTAIMAEQLAGQWYANMTGLGDLVPQEMRLKALQKVYDNNVMKFGNGHMGALNGISAKGEIMNDNEQLHEVWVGTTFSIASEMIFEGLTEPGYNTAKGPYNVVWDPKDGRGYWFRTPEAYDSRGLFRASMYMRPASIWSIEMTPTAQQKTAAPK